MSSLDILVNEHGLIRQFSDKLAIAAEKMQEGERPPREFFEKALQFIRDYVSKFHHFKEEEVMFVQLAQKKRGELDGQIESLKNQHGHGRDLVTEISNNLEGYQRGEDMAAFAILENLAAYNSFIRHHMHREENIFYPMVENELSSSELNSLTDLFKHEDQRLGSDMNDRAQQLIREMGKYL